MVTFVLILALVIAVVVLVGFVLGYNKLRAADVQVDEPVVAEQREEEPDRDGRTDAADAQPAVEGRDVVGEGLTR